MAEPELRRPAAPRRQGAPPLRLWLAAFVLSAAVLGGTYAGMSRLALPLFNPARLARLRARDAGSPPKIVVIGTSLTQHAFYRDEEMERFARQRGREIRFVRLCLSAGEPEDFRLVSELALEAGPDLICLEAAPFSLDLAQGGPLGRHRRFLTSGAKDSFKRWMFGAPSGGRRDSHGNYREELREPRPDTPPPSLEAYRAQVARFRFRSFDEGAAYAPLFAKAAARGVRVAFLDLSRSRDAWDMLPADAEGRIAGVLDRYRAAYGVPYLRFPYRLPLPYFTDYAHLRSTTGRPFYSSWFLEQLPTLLPQRPS